MDELLRFIVRYCNVLYKQYGFRFSNSSYSPESFGNSSVLLENDFLIVEFLYDRGTMFLEFISKKTKDRNHRYSLELLRQIITNEENYYPKLDDENGALLERHLGDIVDLFREDNLAGTLKNLRELEKKRAKKLFG